jgi:hypothetical protein
MMMSIQQTIDIPADRRLYLELPESVPSGKCDLRLIFTPSLSSRERSADERSAGERQTVDFAHLLRNSPKTVQEAIAQAKRKTTERQENPEMDSMIKYAGCLKNSPIFEGDPIEIQRRMRDEWD